MKRTLTLAAASLIAIAGLSGMANAQATTDTPNDAAPAIAPDTGVTGSVSSDSSFSDLMSAIRAGKTNAGQLGSMTDISEVHVVKVDELATGDDAAALTTALSENKDQVTELQTALEGNAALKAELEAQQVQPSSVVATKTEADGSITVFVQ